MNLPLPPTPPPSSGLRALRAMLSTRSPLAAMQVFHADLGDIFRINLPGFSPIVMAGPEAARFVLVEARRELRWRTETDPVTSLLRHSILVEDGEPHAALHSLMHPTLHRRMLTGYSAEMLGAVDEVSATWQHGSVQDMLFEMRKVALLVLTRTLFRVDTARDMERIWDPILKVIKYISPGVWMLWNGAPRPGYREAIRRMDAYLEAMIRHRRENPLPAEGVYAATPDLLTILIEAGLDDDLIRDQLLTMLIAGHDTATALLAWSLYLLGAHPEEMRLVQGEVDRVLGNEPPRPEHMPRLEHLGRVIDESLRLYPPIHLGSRRAARDLEYGGFRIPRDTRVIYSIYLTGRHPKYWEAPDDFRPERHAARPAPYTWLPFGGGPRNCIGGAFGAMEAHIVLARLAQRFDLTLVEQRVHPHMGATLEPGPGVRMRVMRRSG